MNPLVSVIIPTYNGERYVRETVESVLAQSYTPVEILVTDDGSTDSTLEILASFGKRIRVLRGANRGVSLARNSAASEACGEYVAFLDHDDLWEPQMLATLVPLLAAHPEWSFVYSDSWVIDGAGTVRGRRGEYLHYRAGPVFDALLEGNFVPIETMVLRMQLFRELEGFDASLRYIEDFDLCLRAARRGPCGFHPEPLARYRVHQRNLSHNLEPMLAEWERVFEEMPELFPDLSDTERERVAFQRARYALDLAWRAARRGDLPAVDACLARAGDGGPRDTRARVQGLRTLLSVVPSGLRPLLLKLLPQRKLYGVRVAGVDAPGAEHGSS